MAFTTEQREDQECLTCYQVSDGKLRWIQKHNETQTTIIVVPNSVAILGGPNPIGLQPGDAISVRNALFSAMLGSDN